MQCLLDMDGVLVDFVSGICAAHQVASPYPANNGDYVAIERIVGSATKFWAPANTAEFWDELEPMPDFKEILAAVEGAFGRENICILSSPSLSELCIVGKLRWIARHMPDYKRRFLFGPCKEFCAAVDRVLIDDADTNVKRFGAAGGQTILLPRPWNSDHLLSLHPVQVLRHRIGALRPAMTLSEHIKTESNN
ncbi:MAG: hypothetical protein ABFD89_01545 [Bryobacteraceae bacterium]